MEIFKFNYTTDPTVLESGQLITKWTSAMWTERYSEPGEFEIVAPLSSGLMQFLPLDTLISHADTLEVMVVENHEISEERRDDPIITITGRTLDSWLERRFIGVNLARASSTVAEYALTADYAANQVVKMINDHINNPPANANDVLVNVTAQSSVGSSGTSVARNIPAGNVAEKVREVLAIDDLGLRTLRRNTFGGEGSSTQTIFLVYKGVDRTSTVIFSWKSGDLDQTDYLFSNKKRATSALVKGRYIWTIVDGAETKYARRFMIVDASDIDGHLTAPPAGGALTTALSKMTVRGQQALKAQTNVTISQTDLSATTKYKYREDFNVGDLIKLDGNFGQIATMRITEYAEIEDENGESGHPTLSIPGE